jgi:hypothetical protein
MNKDASTEQNLPPAFQQTAPKIAVDQQRAAIAESLFCSPEFAMVDFKKMDEEDWRLHARRSWEVAGFFVSEIRQLKKSH